MAEAIIPLGHQGSNINIPYDEIKFFSKSINNGSFTVSLSIPSFSYIIIQIFNAYNTQASITYYDLSPIVIEENQTYSNLRIGCHASGSSNVAGCGEILSIEASANIIKFTLNTWYFYFLQLYNCMQYLITLALYIKHLHNLKAKP